MNNSRNNILKHVTPVSKVGNLLIPPNWRYEALFNPNKYKLKGFAARNLRDDSYCLRRFLNIGLSFDINYRMTKGVAQIYKGLSTDNKSLFLAIWNRHFKRKGIKKISVKTNNTIFQKSPLWHIGNTEYINDPFLKELVLHHSNFKHNKHIAYALELGKNPDYAEIFKFIGYCIFAKINDRDIAVRWRIPVKHVEALRYLFFDFSFCPPDRVATLSYLRQLTSNGLLNEGDFAYYKRVYDLGPVGLKAQTDFFNLTDGEKKTVEEFLGKSVIANVLNINFSIKSQKDAIEYGVVVSNLANYYIKDVERNYFQSKIRNLDACTKRIEGETLDLDAKGGMSDLDFKFMDLLTEHSLQDSQIEYKTLDSLK